jgi:mono/diheme cytochrome c family protein
MKKNIPILTFILSFILASCGEQPLSEKKVAEAPSGYAIFKKHCVNCHGVDGRMGLNGAKPIPESSLSLEDRIKHISNGKGAMQPYKGVLTEAQIKAVAEYTFDLGKDK